MNIKIHNLLQQLKMSISNTTQPNIELLSFEPLEVQHLEAVLNRKYNVVKRPTKTEEQDLFDKVCCAMKGQDYSFSGKEKKNLIFLLISGERYEGSTDRFIDFIINNANFEKRRGFRNAVYVYLVSYEANNPYTNKLHRKLMATDQARTNIDKIKFLKSNPDLLKDNGHIYLAEKIKEGLNNYLENIGFPKALYKCNFVKEAIRYFFGKKIASNDITMRLFRELSEKEYYDDLFSDIANSIIPAIKANGNDVYREDIIRILNKKLGDPRYIRTNFKWNKVTENNRRTFLTWLNKGTLELFFKIIRDGVRNFAVLNTVDERLRFWEKYLPDMENTWVMLGSNAENQIKYTNDENFLGYGLLKGQSGKSLLMFQIGEYICVEPSDGTFRIWREKDCPIKFGEASCTYANVLYPKVLPKYEKKHLGNWQKEVEQWLTDNYYRGRKNNNATYRNYDSEW